MSRATEGDGVAFYVIQLNVTGTPTLFTIEDDRTERDLAEALAKDGFLYVKTVSHDLDRQRDVHQISNPVSRTLFLGAVVSLHEIETSDWKIERV